MNHLDERRCRLITPPSELRTGASARSGARESGADWGISGNVRRAGRPKSTVFGGRYVSAMMGGGWGPMGERRPRLQTRTAG